MKSIKLVVKHKGFVYAGSPSFCAESIIEDFDKTICRKEFARNLTEKSNEKQKQLGRRKQYFVETEIIHLDCKKVRKRILDTRKSKSKLAKEIGVTRDLLNCVFFEKTKSIKYEKLEKLIEYFGDDILR